MHTGQAGFFKIVSQEPVGKGVRRVTGVTGREAVAAVQQMASVLDDLTGRFNCKPEEVAERVEALQDEIKKLQSQLKKGVAGDLNSAADKLLAAATNVNGAKVIVGEMPPAPVEQMRSQVDRLRQNAKQRRRVPRLGGRRQSRPAGGGDRRFGKKDRGGQTGRRGGEGGRRQGRRPQGHGPGRRQGPGQARRSAGAG